MFSRTLTLHNPFFEIIARKRCPDDLVLSLSYFERVCKQCGSLQGKQRCLHTLSKYERLRTRSSGQRLRAMISKKGLCKVRVRENMYPQGWGISRESTENFRPFISTGSFWS